MCCSDPAAGISDIKSESRGEQQADGKVEKQLEHMVESVNGSSSEAGQLPCKGPQSDENEGSRNSVQAQPEQLGEANSWLAQYLEGILENNVIEAKADYSYSGQDTQGQKQEGQDQVIETRNTLVESNDAIPSENLSLESLLGNLDEFVEIEMEVLDRLDFDEQFQDVPGQCIDMVTV